MTSRRWEACLLLDARYRQGATPQRDDTGMHSRDANGRVVGINVGAPDLAPIGSPCRWANKSHRCRIVLVDLGDGCVPVDLPWLPVTHERVGSYPTAVGQALHLVAGTCRRRRLLPTHHDGYGRGDITRENTRVDFRRADR